MFRNIFFFLIFLTLFSFNAYSKEWYVRPAGGDYGWENGTSYKDSWDGLLNIKWGENGVNPGDTLYVCGLHVYDLKSTSNVVTQANIKLIGGTVESNRVTIRGDYDNDPGIIWGAYRLNHQKWLDEGNGVWSIKLPGGAYPEWIYQDIGFPDESSYTVLKKVSSIDEVRNTFGSQYSESYSTSNKLYVKCTDGKNPQKRIYGSRWGYRFIFDNLKYLTIKNINFYNIYEFLPRDTKYACSHIRIEGCKISMGELFLIKIIDGMDHIEISNCELSWGGNGIYNVSSSIINSPSFYTYSKNYIHNIGIKEMHQNSDAHAIGIQGGRNGIIDGNQIERCGTGPLLYAGLRQELKNTIVSRNFIRNLHTLGSATGYGISTMCNNSSVSDKSGNKFYYNIVANSPVGYRFQFEQKQEFFNNIAYNCDIGFQSSRSFSNNGVIVGPHVVGKNNIFYFSKIHHIEFNTNAKQPSYTLILSHNIFFPDGFSMFKYGPNRLFNFKKWQIFGFDTESYLIDPNFTNGSGDFLYPDDFIISANSPALSSGINVGVEFDFYRSPVQSPPNIGVFEYSTKSMHINTPKNLRIID